MKNVKIFSSIVLASLLILAQFAVALAAPARQGVSSITGTVTEVVLETDITTGLTTVLVTLEVSLGEFQTVRISTKTAADLELVYFDDVLGQYVLSEKLPIDPITVKLGDIIPDAEEPQHPVGSALATFFSDIPDLDYEAIMEAHTNGTGFGVIAQALWLTRKLEGDASTFAAIIQAKQDGDFSGFALEDGSSPTNWGQFRKAVLGDDKKGNLGVVMSQKDNDNNGNFNNGNGNSNKDKNKDKSNNGNGNGNGHKP